MKVFINILNYPSVQIAFAENWIRLRIAQYTGYTKEVNCFLIVISALFKRRILQIKKKIIFGNNDECALMILKIIIWDMTENSRIIYKADNLLADKWELKTRLKIKQNFVLCWIFSKLTAIYSIYPSFQACSMILWVLNCRNMRTVNSGAMIAWHLHVGKRSIFHN